MCACGLTVPSLALHFTSAVVRRIESCSAACGHRGQRRRWASVALMAQCRCGRVLLHFYVGLRHDAAVFRHLWIASAYRRLGSAGLLSHRRSLLAVFLALQLVSPQRPFVRVLVIGTLSCCPVGLDPRIPLLDLPRWKRF